MKKIISLLLTAVLLTNFLCPVVSAEEITVSEEIISSEQEISEETVSDEVLSEEEPVSEEETVSEEKITLEEETVCDEEIISEEEIVFSEETGYTEDVISTEETTTLEKTTATEETTDDTLLDNANSWRYKNGKPIIDQYAIMPIYTASHPDATFTGIDISKHQGRIDWEKVKQSGIDFAIIRCGFGEDNPEYDDTLWDYNASECERLDIPYGVYLYSYAESLTDALSEAEHVLRLIEGRNLSLPVFYDMEDHKLMGHDLAAMAKVFCDRISEMGHPVGVYANLNWWDYHLVNPCFDSWYKWVAQWNESCEYSGDYTIWQYSNIGAVNGISTDVDMNYLIGTPQDHKVWTEKLDTPVVTQDKSDEGGYPLLSWNTVEDAEEYQIWRKAGNDYYSLIDTVAETSFTDYGVVSGTEYAYIVKATCSDIQKGNSYFSEAVRAEYINYCPAGHKYNGVSCTVCGKKHPSAEVYKGKVISVLGDSISTFEGYIPVDDGFNLKHLSRYPQDNLLTDVNETWWMQVISELDAKLGINDSWRGSTVSGAASVTSGVSGEEASMSNLQRIRNLGSNGTPDIIMFYGGTNDIAHVEKTGTFDAATAPHTADLETLKWDNLADGYVNTILRLKHFYPDSDIVALLPTYTSDYYTEEKLMQANAVITEICSYYGVKYTDLTKCGITTDNLPDGIHPDAAGMDLISEAVLKTLLENCTLTKGENVVYSVEHKLTNVKATLGYYKGISAGLSFEEDLVAEDDMRVKVLMGGKDITADSVKDNKVFIESVTGDIEISAMSGISFEEHLKPLPQKTCPQQNIWNSVEHDEYYFTANNKWEIHNSGNVFSVTIPVSANDKIYATSFGKAGTNGHDSIDGIRVVFFGDYSVLKNSSAEEIYAEFSKNGYITAPDDTVAVCIPMWNNNDSNELYIVSAEHDRTVISVTEPTCIAEGYAEYQCAVCGIEYSENTDALGHSFTQYTFNGNGTKTAKCDRCEETETIEDKVYYGTYSENINWFIDSMDTLYIYGEGEMKNLAESAIPWREYKPIIKKVVIENTITTIGAYSFRGCTALVSAVIPDSIVKIGAKAIDNNPSIRFTVSKNSAAYNWLVTEGYTNLDVKIALETIKLAENISLVYGEQREFKAEILPADTTDAVNLVWTVEDETVVTYDAETATLTATGPGTTTVTVTDSISGKTAASTVTVKLPKAEKLTAVWDAEIDKAGLEAGESRTMKISGSTVGELGAKYFDFKSSNEKAVTVDENGVITVVFEGSGTASASATITATVKGDTSKKVSLAVKAIPKQTAGIEIIAEYDNAEIKTVTDENGVQTLIIPRSLVKDGTLPISLKAVAKDADGNEVITNVKWTTDAANIAKVAAVKGTTDSADVTVGKNVDGLAVITATANDLKKATGTIEIDVRDYTPRLEVNTVTLNTFKTGGESVALYTAYDAILRDYNAQMAMLLAEETQVTDVNLSGTGSENFTAVYDSENSTVVFNAADTVKNGTYKLNLNILTAEGETTQVVTVKVANKLPKVTIKQATPFELFLKDSTADITVTATDPANTKAEAAIKAVTMTDSDTFVATAYNTDTDSITVSYLDQDNPLSKFVNGKTADTKVNLVVEFEGYRETHIQKNYTVKAKETKVTLGQSRTSTKFSAAVNSNKPINVIDAKTKEVLDLTYCTVTAQSTSADYVTVTKEGANLTITPKLTEGKFNVNGKVATSHTAKIDVQHENWLRPITISHSISISDSKVAPTMKLKAASLKLNSAFDTFAETLIVPSLDNCPQFLWTVTEQPTKTQTAEDFAKLDVKVNGWKVTAAFKDGVPAKGAYKYLITTFIAGKEVKLALTVNVAETLPNVTLAATSAKLNSAIKEDTAVKFKVPAGYEVTGATVTNSKGNVLTAEDISVEYANGEIAVKVLKSDLAKGNYKYDIVPVVKLAGEEYSTETPLKKVLSLTVNVFNGVPNVTYSAKGKIDLVNRGTGITYTLTKGTNFVYSAADVDTATFKLVGTDADKFNIRYLGTDAKGQHMVEVTAKADAQLKKGGKYSYNIAVDVNGIEEAVTMQKAVTVSPSQSTVKFVTKGSTTIWQSYKGTGSFRIEAATPIGAKIADVQILSAKTTLPLNAVNVEIDENEDGSLTVNYTVTKASKIKVNKAYNLVLEITPEGNGEGVKPQTFTVSFKVKR